VLSEFRTRLVQGSAEQMLFDALLRKCQAEKLLTARTRQRTDSTHVLGAIRAMNRLECVGEVVRHTLNILPVVAPDWLRENSQPEWIDRYGPRVEDARLPKNEKLRQACLADWTGWLFPFGQHLCRGRAWLVAAIASVETLRRVWVQQYYRTETEVR